MFVLLSEGVLPGRRVLRARPLVVRDHLFAAAAVTGERKTAEPRGRGQYPRRDQRADERNEPRSVTAGDGDTLRGGYPLRALRGQLGETVLPARRRAVGGRGVYERRAAALRELRRFARRSVGKTEKDDVRRGDRVLARRAVLAQLVREDYLPKIGARRYPALYAQSGRALPAVYEHRFHPANLSRKRICFSTDSAPVPPSDTLLATHARSEMAS